MLSLGRAGGTGIYRRLQMHSIKFVRLRIEPRTSARRHPRRRNIRSISVSPFARWASPPRFRETGSMIYFGLRNAIPRFTSSFFVPQSVVSQVSDSIVASNGAAPGRDSISRPSDRPFHSPVVANS
jgi:hypothetical protein